MPLSKTPTMHITVTKSTIMHDDIVAMMMIS